jgi:hypothetical protein
MPLPVLCTAGRDSSGADLHVVLDGKSKAMTQAAAVSMLLTSMRKLHTQKESASQQLQQRLQEVRHYLMVRTTAAQLSACLQDNAECIGMGRFCLHSMLWTRAHGDHVSCVLPKTAAACVGRLSTAAQLL